MTCLLQCTPTLLELFIDEAALVWDHVYFLNVIFTWFCKNWISNFNMIWLISQLLVQPLISNLSHHLLSGNRPMFGHTRKNLEKFLRESARNLQFNYENNIWDCIIHAPASWWAQWTTNMHIIGYILFAKNCECFEWSFPKSSSIQCSQIF